MYSTGPGAHDKNSFTCKRKYTTLSLLFPACRPEYQLDAIVRFASFSVICFLMCSRLAPLVLEVASMRTRFATARTVMRLRAFTMDRNTETVPPWMDSKHALYQTGTPC
jgi:hypothetical protein